jgi:hypothetical protein
VPKSLPLADEFAKRLREFELVAHRVNTHEPESWRDAPADDLVRAVALATWWSDKHVCTPPSIRSQWDRAIEEHKEIGCDHRLTAHLIVDACRWRGGKLPPLSFGDARNDPFHRSRPPCPSARRIRPSSSASLPSLPACRGRFTCVGADREYGFLRRSSKSRSPREVGKDSRPRGKFDPLTSSRPWRSLGIAHGMPSADRYEIFRRR